MKRIIFLFLFIIFMTVSVSISFGAEPKINLNAVYVDDGTSVDLEAIVPYRQIAFNYSIVTDAQSIRYRESVKTNIESNDIENEGTLNTKNAQNIMTITLNLTFNSMESGNVFFGVRENDEQNWISDIQNFNAIFGVPPVVNVTGIEFISGDLHSKDISIDINMTQNPTKKLEIRIIPDNADSKDVTWSSSNEKVATVSQSGDITALYPGTTEINVITLDGNFKATCSLTVIRDGASRIFLRPDSIDIKVGEKDRVWLFDDSQLLSYQTISWDISNTEIIRIISPDTTGTRNVIDIEALKSGDAIITASVEGANGNIISAECQVKVYETVLSNEPVQEPEPEQNISSDISQDLSPNISQDLSQDINNPSDPSEPDPSQEPGNNNNDDGNNDNNNNNNNEPGTNPVNPTNPTNPWTTIPTISPLSTLSKAIIDITDDNGEPIPPTWFDVSLLSADNTNYFEGPFRIQSNEEGKLEINVDDLVYASGDKAGEKAYIEGGRYLIRYVDEATGSTFSGLTDALTLTGTQQDDPGRSSGGGGCNSGFSIFAVLISGIKFVLKRK